MLLVYFSAWRCCSWRDFLRIYFDPQSTTIYVKRYIFSYNKSDIDTWLRFQVKKYIKRKYWKSYKSDTFLLYKDIFVFIDSVEQIITKNVPTRGSVLYQIKQLFRSTKCTYKKLVFCFDFVACSANHVYKCFGKKPCNIFNFKRSKNNHFRTR